MGQRPVGPALCQGVLVAGDGQGTSPKDANPEWSVRAGFSSEPPCAAEPQMDGVTFRNSCANVYFIRTQLRTRGAAVIFNPALSSWKPGSAEPGNKCSSRPYIIAGLRNVPDRPSAGSSINPLGTAAPGMGLLWGGEPCLPHTPVLCWFLWCLTGAGTSHHVSGRKRQGCVWCGKRLSSAAP